MFVCFLFLKVDWQGLLKLNKDASIHIKSDNKALSFKDSSKRIWCDYETAGNQENTQSCSWDQPGDEEGDLLIWMDGWMGTGVKQDFSFSFRIGLTFMPLLASSERNLMLHHQ